MADLRSNFVGIKSPNPFWLASAQPTDRAYNFERAFKAGWGGVVWCGVVWKTLGEEGPPAVKPIALNMVAEITRDPETYGLAMCRCAPP